MDAGRRAPVVLIPAYRPGSGLADLVRFLSDAAPGISVVVVDDGSGPGWVETFGDCVRSGAVLLTHAVNQGKGAALRTGFAFIADRMPGRVVVSADADGQHAVADILQVASQVRPDSRTMVLGVREFGPDVPLRSRFGNGLTRVMFRLASGTGISDTQTGLRGFPPHLLAWLLTVGGQRYEYELNMLLRARSADVDLDTVPIRTIYLDHNAASHFRPIIDSARIYWPLLKFSMSSMAAFLIDTVALLILAALTGSLLFAVIGARVLSSTANYLINRRLVFLEGRRLPTAVTAARYFVLAGVLLLANYAILSMLTSLGAGLLVAKVITELTLFGVSYAAQSGVVFAGRGRSHRPASLSAGGGHRPSRSEDTVRLIHQPTSRAG